MGPDTVAAWDIAETQRLIDHPAVRLLRSPNGAFTLTFLHRAFKEHQAISVPESHLRARLENFLDEAREQRPGAYTQTAADYLSAWCGNEHVLLKKFYSDEADEPVFELTTPAERAIRWLEDLQTRPFVGAESRLELIFQQLEEIALFSTPDVERRISALRAQKDALQAQIDLIEATNSAQAYSAVQLTERFANALDLARGLTGDFRQLEENFKEVARALAEAQMQPGATKGRIVGQLLDTHSALKESAQGQSFYAFWNLLSSPERQRTWRDLVRQAYQLEAIDSRLRANKLIERLSTRLLIEGERVVRSNERMAATLRRALESASTGEDRRLRELIREIQQLALANRHSPPAEDSFFELAGPPQPFATFSRTFWQPDAAGQIISRMRFDSTLADSEILERFLALADLNLTRLREQVRTCLLSCDSIVLSEVVDRFPPREGILEVVGYLVIANQDSQYCLASDQLVTLEIMDNRGFSEFWRVPEVLFTRHE
ncbi:MAG TPA: DUF3375 domain-containing protein [Bryobacteraceae bacterium]|jgi:hypothetical protein